MMPPPNAYLRFQDRVAARLIRSGIFWRMPCHGVVKVDQCFRFTKPQRMRGLWRNDFEGSAFCAVPARQCPQRQRHAWLEIASLPGLRETPPGGLYAVDFVGRHSEYGGGVTLGDADVIVDRLMSIREVEAPPPGQMTEADAIYYKKECAASRICMPNSEAVNWKQSSN
jgi:hypothetical protein